MVPSFRYRRRIGCGDPRHGHVTPVNSVICILEILREAIRSQHNSSHDSATMDGDGWVDVDMEGCKTPMRPCSWLFSPACCFYVGKCLQGP